MPILEARLNHPAFILIRRSGKSYLLFNLFEGHFLYPYLKEQIKDDGMYYVLLDDVGRHNVRNRAELEELLSILSSAIGSLTNPTKLSATFKSVKQKTISNTTIKRYIDYFCDSFLIDSDVRYDIKGKKYIDTPVKYYFMVF